MPVIIIAGFLPMFFAAYAYRELNKVAPDCGTSFTWTTKAFGPYVGWLGGWAAIMATVIVLSNLAGVAVQFFYQFLGDLTDTGAIGDLWENRGVNVVTCLVFLAIATWVAYRGITTTERVQIVLVLFQLAVLLRLRHRRLRQVRRLRDRDLLQPRLVQSRRPDACPPSSRDSPVRSSPSGAGTPRSRSTRSPSTPTRRRVARPCCASLSILLTYLIVAIALQMYAGVGTEGNGLANEEISDNVFGALARARPRAAARPGPVPGRARLERGQPDHDVPADLAHHAGDGHLPRLPAEVRHDPPGAQDPVVRHRRGRHRSRRRSTRC